MPRQIGCFGEACTAVLLIEGTTDYTAKSAAADVAPPSFSPSSNF